MQSLSLVCRQKNCWTGDGFAALPGGYGYSGGNFNIVGSRGYWWSATEDFANNVYRDMFYDVEDVHRASHTDKSILFSVRCVRD